MMTSPPGGPTNGSLSNPAPVPPPSPGRTVQDLSYMHRPPTIMPNYGKKHNSGGGAKLKTNVPRVLLYDNVTQQTILDFQLSGLQSQQYKTYRELEMHMKSFTLRSKVRDKLLKNITKVPHFSDYEEFLEEFEKQEAMEMKRGRSLPRLNTNSRISMVSTSPNRSKKVRGVKKRHSDPSFPITKADSIMSNGPVNPMDGSGTQGLLPRIDHLSSVSLVSSKSQADSVSKSNNFEPKRHVGFKMEKSDQGVTRIFHTLPAVEVPTETDANNQSEEKQAAPPTAPPEDAQSAPGADAIGAIVEANLPDENNQSKTDEAAQPDKEPIVVPTVEVHEDNDDEFDTEQPTRDFRFEKLERALVPQDPPNDGFIELSPSFVKKYPDSSFLDQFKRHVKKNLNPADKGNRDDSRSQLSAYSFASDGNPSDDEGAGEEEEKHNSALLRLGNF